MRHGFRTVVVLVSVAVVFGLSAVAVAGQYKTLNTNILAVGQSLFAHSFPQRSMPSVLMEPEVYAFQASPGGGAYRCRIASNTSGAPLTVRLIGFNGVVGPVCTAASGGICFTGSLAVPANAQALCVVTSPGGVPLVPGHYVLAVDRTA